MFSSIVEKDKTSGFTFKRFRFLFICPLSGCVKWRGGHTGCRCADSWCLVNLMLTGNCTHECTQRTEEEGDRWKVFGVDSTGLTHSHTFNLWILCSNLSITSSTQMFLFYFFFISLVLDFSTSVRVAGFRAKRANQPSWPGVISPWSFHTFVNIYLMYWLWLIWYALTFSGAHTW